MHRIMVIDDEENILHSLKRILKNEKGLEVEFYTDPKQALIKANRSEYHLFLSDYRMPGMDGVKFLTKTKQSNPNAMRLIFSGTADFDALIEAINKAEIYRFIAKPIHAHELIPTIRQALHLYDVLAENRRLSDQVREQQNELNNRDLALKKFAEEHPSLAEVDWGLDGSIILEEDDV